MSSAALWLTRTRADLPDDDSWLGSREAQVLARLTMAKRRADWRLGRWAAKAALHAHLVAEGGVVPDAARLEVLAAEDGAPEAHVAAERLPLSLTLSHSEGEALAVVGRQNVGLGCDLEQVAERSRRFADDYFTADERRWLGTLPSAGRTRAVNLLWSAKESALKALRVGLTRDTRELQVAGVELHPAAQQRDERWRMLEVHDLKAGIKLCGRWAMAGHAIMTVVVAGGDFPLLARVP